MSWGAVSTEIYTLLAADTGTGGLLHSGSPLVQGVYHGMAPKDATPPIITFAHGGLRVRIRTASPTASAQAISNGRPGLI